MKATSISRGIASTVETQYRGFGGLIFSSPVISATASLPTRSATLLYTSRASSRSGSPIMPDECASMRSMARWVLPVLVGPSTAVTPTPRARASRLWGAEKETGITIRWAFRRSRNARYLPVLGRKSCALKSGSPRIAVYPERRHGSSRVGVALSRMHRGERLGERFCITMRHRHDALLTSGTSLERIAAESLTRSVSDFVHAISSDRAAAAPLWPVSAGMQRDELPGQS